MFYKYFPGVTLPFATSSLDDIAGMEEGFMRSCVKTIVGVGGFCASFVTEEQIETTRNTIPEQLKHLIEGVKPGPVISVQSEFLSILKEEYVRAFLLHEEGHIVLGHLQSEAETVVLESGAKVINVLQYEIEADAYAAERIGKDLMREALIAEAEAIAHFSTVVVKEKLGIESKLQLTKEEIMERFLSDENIRTRIAALS